MNGFEIKLATRQGVKPLIGLYSESGCGKTMSKSPTPVWVMRETMLVSKGGPTVLTVMSC